jgi:hypothetical protein
VGQSHPILTLIMAGTTYALSPSNPKPTSPAPLHPERLELSGSDRRIYLAAIEAVKPLGRGAQRLGLVLRSALTRRANWLVLAPPSSTAN